jgi:hypothetical protein
MSEVEKRLSEYYLYSVQLNEEIDHLYNLEQNREVRKQIYWAEYTRCILSAERINLNALRLYTLGHPIDHLNEFPLNPGVASDFLERAEQWYKCYESASNE